MKLWADDLTRTKKNSNVPPLKILFLDDGLLLYGLGSTFKKLARIKPIAPLLIIVERFGFLVLRGNGTI